MAQQPGRIPDLSERPYSLDVERLMSLPVHVLYRAWTEQWEQWFAAPGSLLLQGGVDTPFFFVTDYNGHFHPHYGRYLQLEPDSLIVLIWLTSATKGMETVVTVRLTPQEGKTLLQLDHAGFPDEASAEQHAAAWPLVLEQLEQKMSTSL